MLILSDIPIYDTIQATLYKVRREFIPPAPNTQAELDTTLMWFNLRREGSESIGKGDVVHSCVTGLSRLRLHPQTREPCCKRIKSFHIRASFFMVIRDVSAGLC